MHLIADKIANPKKGRRFGADPGKSLGDHPDKGGQIVVKNGRYGPYVSHNGVNATLTGDKTPDTVTLDEAIVLLDARAAAMGNSPKGRRAAGRKAAVRQGRGQPDGKIRGAREKSRCVAKGEEAGRRCRQGKARAPHQGRRRIGGWHNVHSIPTFQFYRRLFGAGTYI